MAGYIRWAFFSLSIQELLAAFDATGDSSSCKHSLLSASDLLLSLILYKFSGSSDFGSLAVFSPLLDSLRPGAKPFSLLILYALSQNSFIPHIASPTIINKSQIDRSNQTYLSFVIINNNNSD